MSQPIPERGLFLRQLEADRSGQQGNDDRVHRDALFAAALDRIAAERRVHAIGITEAIRHTLDAVAATLDTEPTDV